MLFVRKPSFDRSWKKLSEERKERARESLSRLVKFFEGGPKPEGLGLKKLGGDFWEVRSGLGDRVLFRLTSGKVEFILIGNHNDIHRALGRL